MNHSLKGPAVASGLIHLSLLALVSGVSGLGLSSPLEVRIPIEVITVGETDVPASQQSMPGTGRILKDRLRTPGVPSPRDNPTVSPSDLGIETPQAVQKPSHESSVPHEQPPIPLLPPEAVVEQKADAASTRALPAVVAEDDSGRVVPGGQDTQTLTGHHTVGGTAQTDRGAVAAGVAIVASARTDGYPPAYKAAGGGRAGTDNGGLIDGRLLKGGYQVTPRYPESARRAGIEGTALLKFLVQADGGVANVTIERSSGYADLDHAAVQAIRRWRFEPARRDHRVVAAWAVLPVEFRLKRW
ncbi:energy transducer TonB [Candidatus Methylomirabilis sp.]|uniref:energy transducer TonB n=1 Tax=Candidatus Methylomirabilis sp. TaxID=2032687 RepID=UPI002A6158BB|nr:energy transducer TonB [Candidatus Methylomirabilis sp.]